MNKDDGKKLKTLILNIKYKKNLILQELVRSEREKESSIIL
jgi:hypothetical protein